MNIIKTLRTNWRDLVAALVIIIGLAFLADVAERKSITDDGYVWLANVSGVLRGLSNFAGANLSGWFILAVAWPRVNRFGNEGFNDEWDTRLTSNQKFNVYLAIAVAELIAASICFS